MSFVAEFVVVKQNFLLRFGFASMMDPEALELFKIIHHQDSFLISKKKKTNVANIGSNLQLIHDNASLDLVDEDE